MISFTLSFICNYQWVENIAKWNAQCSTSQRRLHCRVVTHLNTLFWATTVEKKRWTWACGKEWTEKSQEEQSVDRDVWTKPLRVENFPALVWYSGTEEREYRWVGFDSTKGIEMDERIVMWSDSLRTSVNARALMMAWRFRERLKARGHGPLPDWASWCVIFYYQITYLTLKI